MTLKDSVRTVPDSRPQVSWATDQDAIAPRRHAAYLNALTAALGRTTVFTRVLLILSASALLWAGTVLGVYAILR